MTQAWKSAGIEKGDAGGGIGRVGRDASMKRRLERDRGTLQGEEKLIAMLYSNIVDGSGCLRRWQRTGYNVCIATYHRGRTDQSNAELDELEEGVAGAS